MLMQIMKKIYGLLKRIIISAFLLYSFNLVMSPLNILIPINLITVSILVVLGIPGLISLFVILLYVY